MAHPSKQANTEIQFNHPCLTSQRTTAATKKQQSSPFLSLAAELREPIYRYAIVSALPVQLGSRQYRIEPALLATCRLVRNEAVEMFWAENEFAASVTHTEMRGVIRRLGKMGKAKCGLILNMQMSWEINVEDTHYLRGVRALTHMTRLATAVAYDRVTHGFLLHLLETGVRLESLEFVMVSSADYATQVLQESWALSIGAQLCKLEEQIETDGESEGVAS